MTGFSRLRRTTVAAGCLMFAGIGLAQSYPGKPITLVVPYPAGAAVDRVGRALATQMSQRLGTTIVVENVGGASGSIGARKVQRSVPDGYTLLLGTVNDMVVAPVVLKAGYSVKDFTPIARLSVNSTVLVAHPGFPANNVDEMVAFAKSSALPLQSGATGVAMMQTIGGTLMAEAAGFKMEHVVYKGGAPLMQDLVAGQVKLGTVALTSALPLIREGKLKALGVISEQRDPSAPNIPAIHESKTFKGISADLWSGLFAPANLPAPVLARLTAVVREVLLDPSYRAAEFKAGSIVVEPGEPQAFAAYLQNEVTRLQPVLNTIKVD